MKGIMLLVGLLYIARTFVGDPYVLVAIDLTLATLLVYLLGVSIYTILVESWYFISEGVCALYDTTLVQTPLTFTGRSNVQPSAETAANAADSTPATPQPLAVPCRRTINQTRSGSPQAAPRTTNSPELQIVHDLRDQLHAASSSKTPTTTRTAFLVAPKQQALTADSPSNQQQDSTVLGSVDQPVNETQDAQTRAATGAVPKLARPGVSGALQAAVDRPQGRSSDTNQSVKSAKRQLNRQSSPRSVPSLPRSTGHTSGQGIRGLPEDKLNTPHPSTASARSQSALGPPNSRPGNFLDPRAMSDEDVDILFNKMYNDMVLEARRKQRPFPLWPCVEGTCATEADPSPIYSPEAETNPDRPRSDGRTARPDSSDTPFASCSPSAHTFPWLDSAINEKSRRTINESAQNLENYFQDENHVPVSAGMPTNTAEVLNRYHLQQRQTPDDNAASLALSDALGELLLAASHTVDSMNREMGGLSGFSKLYSENGAPLKRQVPLRRTEIIAETNLSHGIPLVPLETQLHSASNSASRSRCEDYHFGNLKPSARISENPVVVYTLRSSPEDGSLAALKPPKVTIRTRPLPSTLEQQAPQPERSGLECVVCQDEGRSVLLLPCRHFCLCQVCAARIMALKCAHTRVCPICRRPISKFLKAFL